MRTGDEDLADAAFRHYAAILCPCHDADAGVELILAFRVTQVGQVMEGTCVVPNLFLCTDEVDDRMFVDLIIEPIAGKIERWSITWMELQNFTEEVLSLLQMIGLKCRVLHAHDLKVP